MRKETGVALCVVAFAGAAACGGSSGTSDGDGLSKAEYIERGDAICRGLDQEGESLAAPPPEAPASLHESFLADVLALTAPARDEFQSLPAPDGDEAAKKRLDAYWDEVIDHIERAHRAAGDGDVEGSQRILNELGENEALADGFQDFGFEVCGDT